MKTYQIKFSPKSKKELSKLPKKEIQRVLNAITSLQSNPHIGKKLKGPFTGYYSIRAWPYRIIYTISNYECIVLIIRIGHRKDVYQ